MRVLTLAENRGKGGAIRLVWLTLSLHNSLCIKTQLGRGLPFVQFVHKMAAL